MIRSHRDILVSEKFSDPTGEVLDRLHVVLQTVEHSAVFCQAHELVNRNRITRDPRRILKETRFFRLRPFRFLLNKN
ncbi:MAG: hypothetical protein RJA57_1306 [Bacteroidota bacterium]|jgi:chemotaxis regulatin CheY-phosphate phosphatase CheZ